MVSMAKVVWLNRCSMMSCVHSLNYCRPHPGPAVRGIRGANRQITRPCSPASCPSCRRPAMGPADTRDGLRLRHELLAPFMGLAGRGLLGPAARGRAREATQGRPDPTGPLLLSTPPDPRGGCRSKNRTESHRPRAPSHSSASLRKRGAFRLR